MRGVAEGVRPGLRGADGQLLPVLHSQQPGLPAEVHRGQQTRTESARVQLQQLHQSVIVHKLYPLLCSSINIQAFQHYHWNIKQAICSIEK